MNKIIANSKLFKLILAFCFLFNYLFSSLALAMPIAQSAPVSLPTLRYLSLNSADPHNYFNFLLDSGKMLNGGMASNSRLTDETKKLINYFFLGISLPEDAFWVNLQPKDANRMSSQELLKTDAGNILLNQDLMLKKDVAKYLHPDNPVGKRFWEALYTQIGKDQVKRAQITTNQRVWIIPDSATLVETFDGVFISEAKLKVMLEGEYLNEIRATNDEIRNVSEQLMKEIVIPQLTKDVNDSLKYAPLRQIYFSLILAEWFKSKQKAISSQYASYINSRNTQGLESQAPWSKDKLFQEYLNSYQKGEYSIKRSLLGMARMYFSGGINPAAINLNDPKVKIVPLNSVAGVENALLGDKDNLLSVIKETDKALTNTVKRPPVLFLPRYVPPLLLTDGREKEKAVQVKKDDVTADDVIIELLAEHLKSRSIKVRVEAIMKLSEINDSRAKDLLVKSLKNKSFIVRIIAAELLAEMKNYSFIDPLVTALANEKEEIVRLKIVETIFNNMLNKFTKTGRSNTNIALVVRSKMRSIIYNPPRIESVRKNFKREIVAGFNKLISSSPVAQELSRELIYEKKDFSSIKPREFVDIIGNFSSGKNYFSIGRDVQGAVRIYIKGKDNSSDLTPSVTIDLKEDTIKTAHLIEGDYLDYLRDPEKLTKGAAKDFFYNNLAVRRYKIKESARQGENFSYRSVTEAQVKVTPEIFDYLAGKKVINADGLLPVKFADKFERVKFVTEFSPASSPIMDINGTDNGGALMIRIVDDLSQGKSVSLDDVELLMNDLESFDLNIRDFAYEVLAGYGELIIGPLIKVFFNDALPEITRQRSKSALIFLADKFIEAQKNKTYTDLAEYIAGYVNRAVSLGSIFKQSAPMGGKYNIAELRRHYIKGLRLAFSHFGRNLSGPSSIFFPEGNIKEAIDGDANKKDLLDYIRSQVFSFVNPKLGPEIRKGVVTDLSGVLDRIAVKNKFKANAVKKVLNILNEQILEDPDFFDRQSAGEDLMLFFEDLIYQGSSPVTGDEKTAKMIERFLTIIWWTTLGDEDEAIFSEVDDLSKVIDRPDVISLIDKLPVGKLDERSRNNFNKLSRALVYSAGKMIKDSGEEDAKARIAMLKNLGEIEVLLNYRGSDKKFDGLTGENKGRLKDLFSRLVEISSSPIVKIKQFDMAGRLARLIYNNSSQNKGVVLKDVELFIKDLDDRDTSGFASIAFIGLGEFITDPLIRALFNDAVLKDIRRENGEALILLADKLAAEGDVRAMEAADKIRAIINAIDDAGLPEELKEVMIVQRENYKKDLPFLFDSLREKFRDFLPFFNGKSKGTIGVDMIKKNISLDVIEYLVSRFVNLKLKSYLRESIVVDLLGLVDHFSGENKAVAESIKKVITKINMQIKDSQPINGKDEKQLLMFLFEDLIYGGSNLLAEDKNTNMDAVGGIDLNNVKITLQKYAGASRLEINQSIAKIKALLCVDALLDKKWASLAHLYFQEILLLAKDNIIPEIEERENIVLVARQLKENGYLNDPQGLQFLNLLEEGLPLTKIRPALLN